MAGLSDAGIRVSGPTPAATSPLPRTRRRRLYACVFGVSIACVAVFGHQVFRSNIDVLDTTSPISFFIQDGARVPGFVSPDRELARWALEAWSRESGGKLKFVESKSVESA